MRIATSDLATLAAAIAAFEPDALVSISSPGHPIATRRDRPHLTLSFHDLSTRSPVAASDRPTPMSARCTVTMVDIVSIIARPSEASMGCTMGIGGTVMARPMGTVAERATVAAIRRGAPSHGEAYGE